MADGGGSGPAGPRRDWDAADYVAHSAAQQDWARELIAQLGLRGDERVLDIGCGDGRATALIAERLPHGSVLGVDNSPSMIAKACEQFRRASGGTSGGSAAAPLDAGAPTAGPGAAGGADASPANLEFMLMDARALQLPPAFDVAFSTAALHWIPDHWAILRGVRAALRPGGRLLFEMGGRGNITEALGVVNEVIARPRWRGFFEGFVPPHHFFGREDYELWLPEAGFTVSRIRVFERDMTHAGRPAFLGWLRTTWFTYVDRVPPELAGDFVDEIADVYEAAHSPDEDDVYHVRLVRLQVEAVAGATAR
jgi:trans-aconitate 2-methyltransferase